MPDLALYDGPFYPPELEQLQTDYRGLLSRVTDRVILAVCEEFKCTRSNAATPPRMDGDTWHIDAWFGVGGGSIRIRFPYRFVHNHVDRRIEVYTLNVDPKEVSVFLAKFQARISEVMEEMRPRVVVYPASAPDPLLILVIVLGLVLLGGIAWALLAR